MWSAIRPVATRAGLRAGLPAAAESRALVPARRFVSTNAVNGLVTRVYAHARPGRRCIVAFQQHQHQQTRGYADAAPKTRVPRKKTAAKKGTKTKAKAKKPAAKKTAKTTKAKKSHKLLAPEEQKKLQIRALKKEALLKEPSKLPEHPWILFVSENTKGTKTQGGKADLGSIMPGLAQSFKALSQLELQRLRDTVEKNRESNNLAYKAWVESHPVDVIVDANNARQYLNRISSSKHRKIEDERLPKHPRTSFAFYTKSRWETGQFNGGNIAETAKTLANDWKNLSASERQPFEDRANADKERYEKEVKSILGRDVRRSPSASA